MHNDQSGRIPVRCPGCSALNQVCITHPAHEPFDCSGCNESFVVEKELIRQFYDNDDTALSCLEDFYRAPLIAYFMKRGRSQVDAEKCQIDVFTKVSETKHPRPGNDPQRYDPDRLRPAHLAWGLRPRRRTPPTDSAYFPGARPSARPGRHHPRPLVSS
jgi:hypothetical protein